ncbi:MAG TPA: DUF2017 family protein [Actinomycetota bacterium]|nr:DUF2017 family protein [Actinomycetota bacterium]
MPSFHLESAERMEVFFEEHEADLLRGLLQELRALLDTDMPGDAVRQRLFPRAYQEEEDERSYRELVGDDLERRRKAAVIALQQRLGPSGAAHMSLTRDEADSLLRILTDLRLAIGTRLGVTEEAMNDELDPSRPDAPAWTVLHWLGWVQESMLEKISGPE